MTSELAQYKELLRALFKDDPDTAQQLANDMGTSTWAGTGPFLMAVFGLAVDRRFKTDTSHEAVMAFVGEAEQAFSQAETPQNSLHMELLVRSALGEEQLFQQVPGDKATELMAPLADKIVTDLKLSGQEIDGLLDEAESLVS